MKLVLASTSKFKSAIMDKVKMKHVCIKSDFEEVSSSNDVYEYVKDLAYGKALSVDKMVSNAIIVGIDTIVYMDNKIIEKPKSIEEARNNLKMASGKTTLVITGICLINQEKNEIIKTFQESKVIMNKILDEDIDFYINNEPDIMYASGFIIETVASNFINKIDGSFYNILGVPVEKIYENLLKWDIHLKDLD